MREIHCDNCGKECPPRDIARRTGWYFSLEVSPSHIPLTLLCPDCRCSNHLLTNL